MILDTYRRTVEQANQQLLTGLEHYDKRELKIVFNNLMKMHRDMYTEYLKFYSEYLDDSKHTD